MWTVGTLTNRIRGFGGNDDGSNISTAHLPPFVGFSLI